MLLHLRPSPYQFSFSTSTLYQRGMEGTREERVWRMGRNRGKQMTLVIQHGTSEKRRQHGFQQHLVLNCTNTHTHTHSSFLRLASISKPPRPIAMATTFSLKQDCYNYFRLLTFRNITREREKEGERREVCLGAY